jgi:hypothetical protein
MFFSHLSFCFTAGSVNDSKYLQKLLITTIQRPLILFMPNDGILAKALFWRVGVTMKVDNKETFVSTAVNII